MSSWERDSSIEHIGLPSVGKPIERGIKSKEKKMARIRIVSKMKIWMATLRIHTTCAKFENYFASFFERNSVQTPSRSVQVYCPRSNSKESSRFERNRAKRGREKRREVERRQEEQRVGKKNWPRKLANDGGEKFRVPRIARDLLSFFFFLFRVRRVGQLVGGVALDTGNRLLETSGPTARVAVAVAVVRAERVAGAVMRMGYHLVRHVFLLGEQLLQAYYTGQQQSDLGEEQRFPDQ